jgi:hypothetical protein
VYQEPVADNRKLLPQVHMGFDPYLQHLVKDEYRSDG